MRHVATPANLAACVKDVAQSMSIHPANMKIVGAPAHHGKVATLRVKDEIGLTAVAASMAAHQSRGKA